MTAYTLVFAPETEDTLVELYEYIAERGSPAVAQRYTDAIVTYCESLTTFLLRGILRDDVRPGVRITNYRRRTVAAVLLFGAVVALFPVPADAAEDAAAEPLHLRLVKVMDVTGFGQPMVAATLLLPSDWRVESGVRWTTELGCPQNAVQLSLKASSPDGRLGFEVFPDFAWAWYDDPTVQQYARQAEQLYGARGCELLPPFDAAAYLQHVFLPRWRAGSTLADIGRVEELAEAMRVDYEALVGPSPGGVQTEFDAALATLETPRAGGTDSEWVLASVIHTAAALPMASSVWTGTLQTAASYKSAAVAQFAARAPQGELERHVRLFEAIWRSFRLDPRWDAARLQFWQAIARIEHQGAQDRLRIMEQSRREIGAIVDQTYASRQASLDRQFERRSQALRGVETFVDPATDTRVELSHGYQDAWTNGLGDYVLSDSPGFDPGRELGGNWRALVRE